MILHATNASSQSVCVCACCRAGGGASSRAEVEELREENERVVMQLVEKQMELAMLSEAEVGGWGLGKHDL